MQAKEENRFFCMWNIYFVVNSYHKYCICRETIINTAYFLKKVSDRRSLRFVQSSLIDFLETYWRRGSNSESVVNNANLLRISITPSTSFCDGDEMGLLGTSSSSLLIFSRVSAGCSRYSLTISSIDNGRDLLVATSLSKSTNPQCQGFREPSLA